MKNRSLHLAWVVAATSLTGITAQSKALADDTATPPVSVATSSTSTPVAPEFTALIDLADPAARERVRCTGGEMEWSGDTLVLCVAAERGGTLVFRPPGDHWDLSAYTRVALDFEAVTGEEIKLKVVAKNPGASDMKNNATAIMYLDKGQRAVRPLYLLRDKNDQKQYPELTPFKGMNGLPGGLYHHWIRIDPAHVTELVVSVLPRPYAQEIRIHSIRAADPVVPAILREMGDKFFPFIDAYGQYSHGNWPGKITGDASLKQGFADEAQDLAQHPAPADRDKWGGWKDGPTLEATGFFRVEKVHGKWWFVDPDGKLFWSHGVTGVGAKGATTSTVGRESYFAALPDAQTPLGRFRTDKEYDFTAANLLRALGPDWEKEYADLSHRRMASWGMNTLGMWSQMDVMLQRRTPYTVAVHYGCEVISEKLPDPFSPTHRAALRRSLADKAAAAADPWCIGFFVDNELKWNKPVTLVEAVIAGKPTMAAKTKFIAFLQERYKTIEAFNAGAGTKFADWDALLKNTDAVPLEKVTDACEAFYRMICEAYFKTCREEVKALAPRQLYLGGRFHTFNTILLTTAADYCDVVSSNLYDWDITKKHYPGQDKPFIVGEFHFGAQDRGMWGMGLRWASSQEDRAKLYRDYVRGALQNPNCVGTHWFQYNSQAFTGRHDGENNLIGLTDIGGRPFPELRDAVRFVGQNLYRWREQAR